uniref:Fucosyltransferase n=1 Tax=Meloidogyne enterolobii TaxID=390850 RepID=A0A6V7UMC6_MELEN|nr:unnamed protein product [Meloidogyne enterolobii]
MIENTIISKSKFIFSILIFLSTFLYFLYIFVFNQIIFPAKDGDDKLPGWLKRMSVPVKWPPPTILMWNKMFGASLSESLINYNNNKQCSYKCIYTDNRTLEQQASLLVFHIRDNLDKMPEHRTPQQLYTFFILESPPHTWGLGRDVPPDFFNITMTYRADSDVYYPYDMFEEYTKKDLENGLVTDDQIWTENEIDKKIKAKDKLALQFVSNCNTKSLRELYVNKLKNLTQITQIGTCLDGKRVCNEECADKLIDSHHFYFAFENSVCVNYVTEKFWKLKKLIVPVVLSRKIFKGLNIPDDLFIAADDFKSPKDLVSFLEKLSADKKQYKSYFNWTKKYKKTEYSNDISNPLCNLCKMAHIHKKELKIKNIYDFWNGGGKCEQGFALNVLLG